MKPLKKRTPLPWIISLFLLWPLFLLKPISTLAGDIVTNAVQGVADYYPTYPQPNYATGAPKEVIQKGEYLVKLGDCISCHTDVAEKGKPFAGGLAIKTPFGAFYAPNITPDKKTGIGNWSDEDFIRAMHSGISPDGKYYFPVFPYTSFTKVYPQDLIAIRAYLMSLPAVQQENRKPTAPWPFSWRFAQSVWRLLFFKEGYYIYDPKHSPRWNRGAYIVQGLGHCGECHTPRNPMGAMKNPYFLTGAFIGGYWAPDITGYGLATTPEEVLAVFKKSELINKAGPVRGPMAEVNHNSLSYLAQEDLDAIVDYLMSLKPHLPPKKIQQTHLKIGKAVYKRSCAICHNTGMVGAPLLHAQGNWHSRLAREGIKDFYRHVIDGFNQMPPKGGCVTCTNDELIAAVDYIITSNQSMLESPAPKGALAALPNTSVERGQVIYQKSCAQCHDKGVHGAPKLGDQTLWSKLLQKNLDILIVNTTKGMQNMPAKGGCQECTNADIIAAVKYMVETSVPQTDYSLW